MVLYINIEVAVKVHIVDFVGTCNPGIRQISLSLCTCECTRLSTRQNNQSICLYAAVIHEQRIVIVSRCHIRIQLAAREAGVLHVVHSHVAWGFTWRLPFANHGRGSLEFAVQHRVNMVQHILYRVVHTDYCACTIPQ